MKERYVLSAWRWIIAPIMERHLIVSLRWTVKLQLRQSHPLGFSIALLTLLGQRFIIQTLLSQWLGSWSMLIVMMLRSHCSISVLRAISWISRRTFFRVLMNGTLWVLLGLSKLLMVHLPLSLLKVILLRVMTIKLMVLTLILKFRWPQAGLKLISKLEAMTSSGMVVVQSLTSIQRTGS